MAQPSHNAQQEFRKRMPQRKPWVLAMVVTLLLIISFQILHAIHGQSLTWDEADHIFAGYETWRTGDFGLNPEHPPLVKGLATLPLLALDLKVPPLQNRFFKDEAYLDGRELLFRNQPAYSPRFLTFLVRVPTLLFTLIAALLVFAAGCEMFNVETGLVALFLFTFEPNLLAHGAYVTTDMAASCTIFATVYALWRYVQRPSLGRLLVVGVAAGFALAAKHSTVLLAPILVVLILGERIGGLVTRRPRMREDSVRLVGVLAATVLIAVGILWAFYGFRYNARPAPLALAPTLVQYTAPLAPREAHGILFAARWHLLPESWLFGLTDVRTMANDMPSYFFGRVYNHGIWYYFPAVFLIKSTLAELALLALTLFAVARGWLRNYRALWFLCAPPLLYLLFAMGSHLNIGARHILNLWVFAAVIAAAGAVTLARRSRGWLVAVGILLVCHAATTAYAAPNYMAYANEAFGGPAKTYKYLTDSNTDWAQQLVATSDYVREHKIHDCWIAYFAAPFLLPSDYGIPCKRLPTFDSLSEPGDFLEVPPVITGPVFLSAGDLNGFEFGSSVLNPYESFEKVTPADRIQDGIFVYDGTFAVPLAAALTHSQRADALLKAGDVAGALREARTGEQLAPTEVTPNLTLAKVLPASHEDGATAEAREAIGRAEARVQDMDPATRAQWQTTVDKLESGSK
jgi:4-amino-4-deoxy-L-arabinose transferase-like glycosyltransferase